MQIQRNFSHALVTIVIWVLSRLLLLLLPFVKSEQILWIINLLYINLWVSSGCPSWILVTWGISNLYINFFHLLIFRVNVVKLPSSILAITPWCCDICSRNLNLCWRDLIHLGVIIFWFSRWLNFFLE